MGFTDTIYQRAPLWAQHAMFSTYGLYWRHLRLGGEWAEDVRAFRAREPWTAAQWRAYTTARLRDMLVTAVTRVPHYRDRWRETGLTRADVARFEIEDLARVPELTKADVRRAPDALLVDGIRPAGIMVQHTSGSTGTPLQILWTRREMRRSVALREARSAGWAGVSYRGSRATFSGRQLVPDRLRGGPFHRFNLAERQVYFSPFHLGPSTVAQYVDALRQHRPDWLNGYAFSYYTLARLAQEAGLDVPSPTAVVTTSEKVTPAMRRVMEAVYGCKVYEEYGTVEDVMYVCECEHGGLHVNPDAGIVEILDAAGQPAPPGQPGRVVATGFVREQQLFVRFALGDEAAWATTPCTCGREMPCLLGVTGRLEDAVVGPDGREMVRFHGIFADQPHVVEGQIVQETPTHIVVRVVTAPGFSEVDARSLRQRITTRLTEAVRVDVEPVTEIPRSAAGKYQAVISKVARPPRPAGGGA